MVTVFLRGGLGNQMFEYAAALDLAKKNSTEVVFDTVFMDDRFPRRNITHRSFDLDVFTLKPRFTVLSKVAHTAPIPGVWLGLDLAAIKAQQLLGVKKIVKEKGDHFDPIVPRKRGNLLLYGRWQSEKYFADNVDEVRAAFRFRHALEGEAKTLAGKIASCNSVSLHVRRGDYAAFKNVEQVMGSTDLGYYDRAAKYIGERVKDPQIFVFSDDIAWCRKNIKLPFPSTYVDDASSGPKSAFHLELMSLCKHNIITNSTFSWWGAWLNANPEKIVIAPKHWYADPAHANDVVPDGWIKT